METSEASGKSKQLAEAVTNSSDMFRKLKELETMKHNPSKSSSATFTQLAKEDDVMKRTLDKLNSSTRALKTINLSESANTSDLRRTLSLSSQDGWPAEWSGQRASFSSEADSTFSFGMESLLHTARNRFTDLTGLTMPSMPDVYGSEGVDLEGAFFLCRDVDDELVAILPADGFLEARLMTYMLDVLTGPVEVELDLAMPRSVNLKTKGFVSVCTLREAIIQSVSGKRIKVNLVTRVILIRNGKKRFVSMGQMLPGKFTFIFMTDPRLRTSALE